AGSMADDRSKLALIGDYLILYLLHRLRKGPIQRGPYPKEIEVIIGLSPRTVSTHLEHIYDKLGVRTRTEAVRLVVEQGLLRP
ncbi:MAG: response regulator transcription factor, partial [candidate division NC10 bacterium]|nr:response regulator transcription factor [candidate division NC10 bacterium]